MSIITREQAQELRNSFQCWQQDYDPVEDKEQYDMFGLGIVAMDALTESMDFGRGKIRRFDLDMSGCDSCGQDCGADMVEDLDGDYVLWDEVVPYLYQHDEYTAPPASVVADLCAAIEALLDMQVRMVKQTNQSASFYDSETISAMNYVPIQARQALELAKPYK